MKDIMSKIIIILSFFILFFPNKSFSETAICEPNCPETPFLNQYPCKVDFQIGTCRFIADFYIRKACDIWCDIMLLSQMHRSASLQ